MRVAARGWEEERTPKMVHVAFTPSTYAPMVFRRQSRYLRCVVHGDDLTCAGASDDLTRVAGHMRLWYEVKIWEHWVRKRGFRSAWLF